MRTLRLAVLLPLLVLPAAAQGIAPAYVVTEACPDVPGSMVGLADVSDTGHVVGWFIGEDRSLGFRWSPGSGATPSAITLLDPPPTWGDYQSVAVNDAGTVVGRFGTSIGGLSLNRGFRWKDGEIDELFTTQGLAGSPEDVNNAGWIAGMEGGRLGGSLRGMLWGPDLQPVVIEELTQASAINDLGQVVGWRFEGAFPYVARAYLWDDGVVTPLGTLDPQDRGDVGPLAIDERGRVVGVCEVGSNERAFLWTAATGMTELVGPHGITGEARAYDVNDAGWIVGYAPGPLGIVDVLWGPDGSVHELGPRVTGVGPGTRWSQLFWALAINDAGQIAGGALDGTSVRPVLLTPAHLDAGELVTGRSGWYALPVGGARCGKPVFLLGAFDDGRDRAYGLLPGCGPIGLALAQPRLVSWAPADGCGETVHAFRVPPSLTGVRIALQALQLGHTSDGGAVSEVVRFVR